MWWKIILAVLAMLIIATVIKAIFFKPKKIDKIDIKKVDIDKNKVAEHISRAIQFKTISKHDDINVDWDEFDKFHDYLDETFPLIAQKLTKETIGRASLIYHWKGKNPDLEPMAMLGHQDVVPVAEGTQKDWTHDAFEGFIDDEFVWGRGAMDMKNHLICVMEAVESLLGEGFTPERDVYLCFGHNEETVASSCSGAAEIVRTLKERGIHLDSVLDEGTMIIRADFKGLLHTYIAPVGVGEKGYADIKITMHDKGGHTSAAPKHSGMAKLANAVQDLESNQFKAHWLPVLTELFSTIGRKATFLGRLLLCNIPILSPLFLMLLKSIPASASLVRTITSVSMCEGSPAPNVLPQRPNITVNFRMLQGDTLEDVKKHIRKHIRYKDVEIDVLRSKEATTLSPTDSRAFKAIESVENSLHPDDVAVAPFLVMGGTDACHYHAISDNVLRFAPFNAPLSLMFATHATNERCPIDCLEEAVVFFREYIIKASDQD